ncbi:MAG: NfeD family protein [Acidobacteriota bacterium]
MMQGMAGYLWIVWLVIAALFALVETFTVSFIALWFGIGAAGAALVAAFGFGVPLQLLTFIITSTVLTISTRRIFLRWLDQSTPAVTTPADLSLVGKRGVVVTVSNGSHSKVELELDGTVWTAQPIGEERLKTGQECEVIGVEGNHLYVRPIQLLPDWKFPHQYDQPQH